MHYKPSKSIKIIVQMFQFLIASQQMIKRGFAMRYISVEGEGMISIITVNFNKYVEKQSAYLLLCSQSQSSHPRTSASTNGHHPDYQQIYDLYQHNPNTQLGGVHDHSTAGRDKRNRQAHKGSSFPFGSKSSSNKFITVQHTTSKGKCSMIHYIKSIK